MAYIIIIVLLTITLLTTGYIIYRQSRILKLQKQEMLHRHEHEIAATIEDFQGKQALLEQQYEEERFQLQQQHYLETERLNGSIDQLNQYIYELQSYSRNIGEVKTHQTLHDFKERLMREGKIEESNMLIIPNSFIPFHSEYGLKTRKIDHLVLLPTGIYVVQTKYWKGKVIHGLNTENAGDFSFLLDLINEKSYVKSKEQSFVFVSSHSVDEHDEFTPVIQVKAQGELTKQIKYTSRILCDFLSKKMGVKADFITPVMYFGYQNGDQKTHGLIDLSDDESVIRLTNEKELCAFFEAELQKPTIYHAADLLEIKSLIEHVHYAKDTVNI
ncbi:nuclease-related domain-containing protein [Bacillus songklensis]|uniref:Nuclease-related domain-containing protein n=1 Tax=Bacillus songklensis TaxID=1069116 RepID=A0ABV8B9T3_9BACI